MAVILKCFGKLQEKLYLKSLEKHKNSKLKVGNLFCFRIDYIYEFDNSLPEMATYFIRNNITINDIFEIVETKLEVIDGKKCMGVNKIKRLSDGLIFDFKDTLNETYSCFINDACDDEFDIIE